MVGEQIVVTDQLISAQSKNIVINVRIKVGPGERRAESTPVLWIVPSVDCRGSLCKYQPAVLQAEYAAVAL